MIEAAAIAGCPWRDPGGEEAAQNICAFLNDIGIELDIAPIGGRTFVPGIAIEEGRIVIDPEIASFPGDLLHEAGHLAIVELARRATMSEVGNDGGEEMAAIAWSVAAAKASNTALDVLFHADGYKGDAERLVTNFSNGHSFGVPLLAWYGLTEEKQFPQMRRWLR